MNADKKLLYAIAAKTGKIRDIIPEAALYAQMAEECNEMSKACLKKVRKLRGENFTPISDEQIDKDLNEEFADISLCAVVLGLTKDYTLMNKKLNRWIKRNEKHEKDDADATDKS